MVHKKKLGKNETFTTFQIWTRIEAKQDKNSAEFLISTQYYISTGSVTNFHIRSSENPSNKIRERKKKRKEKWFST